MVGEFFFGCLTSSNVVGKSEKVPCLLHGRLAGIGGITVLDTTGQGEGLNMTNFIGRSM